MFRRCFVKNHGHFDDIWCVVLWPTGGRIINTHMQHSYYMPFIEHSGPHFVNIGILLDSICVCLGTFRPCTPISSVVACHSEPLLFFISSRCTLAMSAFSQNLYSRWTQTILYSRDGSIYKNTVTCRRYRNYRHCIVSTFQISVFFDKLTSHRYK